MSIEDVGAINIALKEFSGKRWPKIYLETLASWDPDVILITSSVSNIH